MSKNSSDTDDPVVIVDSPRRYGRREPQVFQLHRRGQLRDKKSGSESREIIAHEPAVIYGASVFNFENVKRGGYHRSERPKPSAVYYDDHPLGLAQRLDSTEPLRDPTSENAYDDVFPGSNRPIWKGRVFEAITEAVAHFPFHPIIAPEDGPLPSPGMPVTSDIDSLKFIPGSRSGINIKSPFLYVKLAEMVGYYPSFRRNRPGDLQKLSCKSAKEIYTDFTLFEPFGVLMHHFPQIEAVANEVTPESSDGWKSSQLTESGQTTKAEVLRLQRQHMWHLFTFLHFQYDTRVVPCQMHLEEPSPRVAFDMLWFIFKPGTNVYVWTNKAVHACVVADIRSNLDDHTKSQFIQSELKYWVLTLWYLTSDGTKIGRMKTKRRMSSYAGLREITKLGICPVSTWDTFDKGGRRQKIMERSAFLFKSLQQGYLFARYDGPTTEATRYYSGSVVVDWRRGLFHTGIEPPNIGNVNDYCDDFSEYDNILVNEGGDLSGEIWNEGPGRGRPRRNSFDLDTMAPPRRRRRRSVSSTSSFGSDVMNTDAGAGNNTSETDKQTRKDLTDHQLFLLFPMTRAFALKTKQWLMIWADYLSEIVPSQESIENLVLGEDELKTIRGLSRRQNSTHDIWAADFIEGKGKGQIILLHGPPGVGKTYTVEAIAELLHRPLLALTVADIGTMETRVERELVRWFALAEAWNAVLLVDEADIFLERRQSRDLARNGLVSAFLRRMEYFTGLLFLTTNRVGHIDDAFISRVHVAIGYKTLSGEDRQKVWNGFFRKLVKERAGKIQIAPGAKKWVLEMAASGKAQLNGRDIRNALQTAITLAEAESDEDPDFDSSKMAIVVDQSHFQRVLDISLKFHDYVKSIRREDEKKRAAGRFDRNDYFED